MKKRLWFAVMASVLWIGIYFTGFGNIHWLIYLPAGGFTIATIFGICPSEFLLFNLFRLKN